MILCRAAGRSRAAGTADTVPLNAQWLTNSTFSPPKCGNTFSATARVTIAHKTKLHGFGLVSHDSSSPSSCRIALWPCGATSLGSHHRIVYSRSRPGTPQPESTPSGGRAGLCTAQATSMSRRHEPAVDQLHRQLSPEGAALRSPSLRGRRTLGSCRSRVMTRQLVNTPDGSSPDSVADLRWRAAPAAFARHDVAAPLQQVQPSAAGSVKQQRAACSLTVDRLPTNTQELW